MSAKASAAAILEVTPTKFGFNVIISKNFTFNDDKTFTLEIGSALSFKTNGTYEHDKEKIDLSFSDDSKTTFKYEFNENKTELSLTPETEFKWFKATLKFNKVEN